MAKTRLLMIGGFLGAGKTTVIARLAKHYTDLGKRVGIVTNDQAYGLVDTHTLRAQGFQVGEVPGACFCCKFDDLVQTAAGLGAEAQPDILLTEPVGSCTDLMATVLQPLRHLFGDRYETGPLVVLCKPEHGQKILGKTGSGFSPQAAYIFKKQLEEAQLIALNKVDRLTEVQQHELLTLIGQHYPDHPVLAMSATTGQGFLDLVTALEEDAQPWSAAIHVDYDTYATGEASLGWLNCSVEFSSESPTDEPWQLDQVTQKLVDMASRALLHAEMEPGHAKVLAAADSSIAVANWVASDAPVELSVASGARVRRGNLLVNIRAHGDPEQMALLVQEAISETASSCRLQATISQVQHFRPGRPEPTHRFATQHG